MEFTRVRVGEAQVYYTLRGEAKTFMESRGNAA